VRKSVCSCFYDLVNFWASAILINVFPVVRLINASKFLNYLLFILFHCFRLCELRLKPLLRHLVGLLEFKGINDRIAFRSVLSCEEIIISLKVRIVVLVLFF